jgi:beta-galactosidase
MAEQGAKIGATMVRRCHELDPTRVVSAAVNGDNEKASPSLRHHRLQLQPQNSPTSSTRSIPSVPSTARKQPAPSPRAVSIPPTRCATGQALTTAISPAGARPPRSGGSSTARAMGGRRLCLDRLRLSRRANTLRLALDQLAVRHRRHVRLSQGHLLLLQSLVGQGRSRSLHLFPHWNWEGREGEPIKIWVHSNLDEVELFVNGVSPAARKFRTWAISNGPRNTLPASSKRAAAKTAKSFSQRSAKPPAPRSIRSPDPSDRTEIDADGEDIAYPARRSARQGRPPVPTADNFIGFKVSGEGKLIGVGNGDPNCQESDKEPKRSLFNGLAQVIVQSTKEPGEIHIEAVKEGWDGAELTPAKLSIKTKKVELRPQVG